MMGVVGLGCVGLGGSSPGRGRVAIEKNEKDAIESPGPEN
jgi:hypothetical protein